MLLKTKILDEQAKCALNILLHKISAQIEAFGNEK